MDQFLHSTAVTICDNISDPNINIIDEERHKYYYVPESEYATLYGHWLKAPPTRRSGLYEVIQTFGSSPTFDVESSTIRTEDAIEQLAAQIFQTFNISNTQSLYFAISPTNPITSRYYVSIINIYLRPSYIHWFGKEICKLPGEFCPKVQFGQPYSRIYEVNANDMRARFVDLSANSLITAHDLLMNYTAESTLPKMMPEPIPELLDAAQSFVITIDHDLVYRENLTCLRENPILSFFYQILEWTTMDVTQAVKCLISTKSIGRTPFENPELLPQYTTLARYYMTKHNQWDPIQLNNIQQQVQTIPEFLDKNFIVMSAQLSNPTRFKQALDTLCTRYLLQHILEEPDITSRLIAELMFFKHGHTYVTKINLVGRATWYHFNTQHDRNNPGMIYKWEELPDTSNIKLQIESLRHYKAAVEREMVICNAVQPGRAKEYTRLLTKFYKQTDDIVSINKILDHLTLYCTNSYFINKLNTASDIIGTTNGILYVGKDEPIEITTVHTVPISFSTCVKFHKYINDAENDILGPICHSPSNPHIKRVLSIIDVIMPEPDARDFLFFYNSLALKNGMSIPGLFGASGDGSNGKTTLVMMFAKCFGEMYAAPLNMSLFTGPPESAQSPNSAMMAVENKLFVYAEESQRGAKLTASTLKRIFGNVSARDLNEKQKAFKTKARIMIGTNYPLIVEDRDHGTWRRIWWYYCRQSFTERPTDDPGHRKLDTKIENYIETPECREAVLSLLVYYYMHLKRHYNGELQKVPAPTILRDTLQYRNSQDTINNYITKQVLTPINQSEELYSVKLSELIHEYIAYCEAQSGKVTITPSLHHDFNASILKERIYENPDDRETYVRNCRAITQSAGLFAANIKADCERFLINY
jgi:phage/plasmid-associated DNA primase